MHGGCRGNVREQLGWGPWPTAGKGHPRRGLISASSTPVPSAPPGSTPAADKTAPTVTAKATKARIDNGVTLTLKANEAGTTKLTMTAGKNTATTSFTLATAGTAWAAADCPDGNKLAVPRTEGPLVVPGHRSARRLTVARAGHRLNRLR
jgi:hypothetical protein